MLNLRSRRERVLLDRLASFGHHRRVDGAQTERHGIHIGAVDVVRIVISEAEEKARLENNGKNEKIKGRDKPACHAEVAEEVGRRSSAAARRRRGRACKRWTRRPHAGATRTRRPRHAVLTTATCSEIILLVNYRVMTRLSLILA